jgi:serine/threonine protein kinase
VSGKPYKYLCDWWSLGIILDEMLYGARLFDDTNLRQLYHRITCEELPFAAAATPEAKALIWGLCRKQPA